MTWLRLYNCKKCCILPPIGQLPTLKRLDIFGLERVVSIGDEFLKDNDRAFMIPFRSLEDLLFSSMASLEQWHSIDMEVFPNLQRLEISDCPKLVGNLPDLLPSLVTLQIIRCPMFSSSLPRCPKLHNVETHGIGNVLWQEQELPRSLCMLVVSGSQMLELMLEALSEHLHLQQLTISDCSNISTPTIHLPLSLQHLIIRYCENVNFVMSSNASLPNLQSIYFVSCNFVKFMSDNMEGLLPNLRKLHIDGNKQMEAFPEGIHMPSLRDLHIEGCNMRFMLSLQAEWHLLNNITYLCISRCIYVKRFREGRFLPTTLTTLELEGLYSLKTLDCARLQHLTSLQQLKISYCRKLEKVLGEKLPTSLRKLHIWECPLLEEKYHNKDEDLLCKISHVPIINLFKH